MTERRRKVHYAPGSGYRTLCGLDPFSGGVTWLPNETTCRVCMYRYLASMATWAPGFLDDLRGRSKLQAVIIPAGATEPVDGIIERASGSLGRPFRQQRGSQKAIGELLTISAADLAAIKKIMHHSGPPAESVRVQGGQVAERAGDAGKICDEPGRDD